MFTRAPGPACVNGCVRVEPHCGHAMRSVFAGFGAGWASPVVGVWTSGSSTVVSAFLIDRGQATPLAV